MLASQSGQTKLRIAEVKLLLLFLTTANNAIMSLPVVAVLHHRMHRTLSAGPQARFGEGARWTGAAAPRFGFKSESNCVAKCFARKVSASYNVYPVSMKEIG